MGMWFVAKGVIMIIVWPREPESIKDSTNV